MAVVKAEEVEPVEASENEGPSVQCFYDSKQNPTAVLVPIAIWEQLMEELDDLEDHVAILEERLNPSERTPLEEVMKQMRAKWSREIQDGR